MRSPRQPIVVENLVTSAKQQPHPEAAAPVSPIASVAFHRALLDSMLDPTLAIDDHGTVVLASASVERLLGWKPAELVGRNIKVVMPEPHASAHDGYLANYRKTGMTNILGRTREFDVVHKDGHLVVCELSVGRADIPETGSPLFIGTFRDITARKAAERALEASERRFRAIFDRSYEYIGLLQPDGTLLEANQAALDVIGAVREDVVGRKFWDTPWWSVSKETRERLKSAVHEAAEGKFVRFETEYFGRGDDVLSIDFSINPIRDGNGRIVLLIPEGRNITELKRAQRTETGMLRALATLGESSAMLAHEIKNPITAVNLALRAVAKQLGEDERAVLADLVTRMQRLEALMRRTLSFAKPLALRVTSIRVRELFDEVVEELRPEIVKRGAAVELGGDIDLQMRGDRQLLHDVLTNLIKNSLEACDAEPYITLSARHVPPGDTLLAVDDNGPGVPTSLRGSLFNPFNSTKSKGTGLGLAFCRKVLLEHGGTIDVLDSDLGGARFEMHLPSKLQ